MVNSLYLLVVQQRHYCLTISIEFDIKLHHNYMNADRNDFTVPAGRKGKREGEVGSVKRGGKGYGQNRQIAMLCCNILVQKTYRCSWEVKQALKEREPKVLFIFSCFFLFTE